VNPRNQFNQARSRSNLDTQNNGSLTQPLTTSSAPSPSSSTTPTNVHTATTTAAAAAASPTANAATEKYDRSLTHSLTHSLNSHLFG
jgi:hypothetical protein